MLSRSHVFLSAMFFSTVTFLTGCSKSADAPAKEAASPAAATAPKVDPRVKFAGQFNHDEMVKLGEKLYQTPGTQTCLQCHRGDGRGEGYAGAAVLQKPWTWRVFNGLGGYDALKADPAGFREKMETSLAYLFKGGALNWTANFAKEHPGITYDWSKTGKSQYDMMMWGLWQPEMKNKAEAVRKELESQGKAVSEADFAELAPYAVLEYVKGFEKPNKLADGSPAPKILEPYKPSQAAK